MPYADYDFYTTFYKGSLIPEDEYNKYALKASGYIDYVTNGTFKVTNDNIKICNCEIAEYYFVNGLNPTPKASESVGNYTVTYGNSLATADDELRAICRLWLPSNLMYRGANGCFHEV